MSLLVPIISLLAVTGLAVTFSLHRNKQRGLNTKRCLQELADLKQVVILIQRHRGLSCGYLNGDIALDDSITPLQQELNQLWCSFDQAHPHIQQDKLYMGIREHWSRLQGHWRKQVLSNNMEQHNRLILNLLYLIENEAERNALLVKLSRTHGHDIAWKELLDTIETIGQTRATGMAVIAVGECSAVARIKLKFLLDKGQSQLEQIEQHFGKCQASPSEWSLSNASNQHLLKEAQQRTQALFNCIEEQVISTAELSYQQLSAKHFFDLASAAISPLDQLFNQALEQLNTQLSA